MNPASLRAQARSFHPQAVRQHPMFGDPVSVIAFAASVLINILCIVLVLVRIHHVDYPVPVHYLSLVGFDQVGQWYQNYRLAAFSVIVTITNGALAGKSFQRNRLASFFLLIGAVVVALLCLVITAAFASIQ